MQSHRRVRRIVHALATGSLGLLAAMAVPAAAAPALNVTAVYEGALLIKLLDLRLHSQVADGRFGVDAHVESSGAVSFIRRFDINAASVGALDHGRPVPTAYVQHALEGQKRSSRTQVWRAPSPVTDPLTAALKITATPVTSAPCLGVMPVFDGKQRYDLILNYAGAGQLAPEASRLGLVQPARCRMSFRPLSGFKSNNQDGLRKVVRGDIIATFAKAPAAGVWILTDVDAETLIGGLHLRLTSLSIQGARAAFTGPAVAPPTAAKPNKTRRR